MDSGTDVDCFPNLSPMSSTSRQKLQRYADAMSSVVWSTLSSEKQNWYLEKLLKEDLNSCQTNSPDPAVLPKSSQIPTKRRRLGHSSETDCDAGFCPNGENSIQSREANYQRTCAENDISSKASGQGRCFGKESHSSEDPMEVLFLACDVDDDDDVFLTLSDNELVESGNFDICEDIVAHIEKHSE